MYIITYHVGATEVWSIDNVDYTGLIALGRVNQTIDSVVYCSEIEE